LDSSQLLITAASGLERLMNNASKDTNLRDSNVAQISAAIYYKANVISQLQSNNAFQKKFREVIYGQIERDFGDYIDSQARTKPKSLHHVYEWNKTGSPEGRLFKLKSFDNNALSFRVGYDFKLSKSNVPSPAKFKKYKFANKAYVMENGIPVTIAPKAAERLVFEVNGYTVFMPKGRSITVSKPGGGAATHQFRLAYSRFFRGNLVGSSIRRSGFQQLFNSKMSQALKVPGGISRVQYSFSPNTVRSQASAALSQAFGGSL
jgi:hypothetical protein